MSFIDIVAQLLGSPSSQINVAKAMTNTIQEPQRHDVKSTKSTLKVDYYDELLIRYAFKLVRVVYPDINGLASR